MSFHVGQKVVCVHDEDQDPWPGDVDVVYGQVYTVRNIEIVGAVAGLFLCEIINPICWYWNKERAFDATRFRPVIHTDISIFTAMLNPVPKRVSADA